MSLAAALSVAALLIASPSTNDAAQVAANGGFLLGNAHRCGIPHDRIVRTGRVVRDLIIATAADTQQQDEATARFARFFIVSAFVDQAGEKLVASCPIVSSEFERLERHSVVGDSANVASRADAGRRFGPGDGE